jgi:phosphoribosylpyrophosphate synthetase
MKLLAGNSNLPLARSISDYLETPLTDASVRRFADEEVFVEINENVRGEDVFVIQSTSYPANDNLMELLICVARPPSASPPCFLISAMPGRTGSPGRAPPFRPNWSPT